MGRQGRLVVLVGPGRRAPVFVRSAAEGSLVLAKVSHSRRRGGSTNAWEPAAVESARGHVLFAGTARHESRMNPARDRSGFAPHPDPYLLLQAARNDHKPGGTTS
jgi:hypothetical protein